MLSAIDRKHCPPSNGIPVHLHRNPHFERAHALAPGWDRYALEQIYLEWASDKDAARSEDARFLGWVKSYTKGKPAP
jgi:L-rhamnose isomerase